MVTCDMFAVCGLAGVWGLLGGVSGGWNLKPELSLAGDCGPRTTPRKPPPSPDSRATGEGGLSSSDCDLRRYTTVSSTYLLRKA